MTILLKRILPPSQMSRGETSNNRIWRERPRHVGVLVTAEETSIPNHLHMVGHLPVLNLDVRVRISQLLRRWLQMELPHILHPAPPHGAKRTLHKHIPLSDEDGRRSQHRQVPGPWAKQLDKVVWGKLSSRGTSRAESRQLSRLSQDNQPMIMETRRMSAPTGRKRSGLQERLRWCHCSRIHSSAG